MLNNYTQHLGKANFSFLGISLLHKVGGPDRNTAGNPVAHTEAAHGNQISDRAETFEHYPW